MQKSDLFWFESRRVFFPRPSFHFSIFCSKWRWNCCGHVGELGLSGERGKSWWRVSETPMWVGICSAVFYYAETTPCHGIPGALTQAAVLPHRVIKMNTMQIFFASQRYSAISSSPNLQFWMGRRCKFFPSIGPESLHWCVCITVFTLQLTDADPAHRKRTQQASRMAYSFTGSC